MQERSARELFGKALDLPARERIPFLVGACGTDNALLDRVMKLLSAHEEESSFLSSPTASAVHPVASPIERPESLIGRYRILQLIGEGGFGSVFMAEQREPVVRRVALKIVKLGMDTEQVIGRFEAERQALALMDHPNIAKVLDAGCTETGRPYFVMELVSGEPITQYCDANKLSIDERLGLFRQVCSAVQHAHTKGIIHRDIKPSNVLATTQDGRPYARVIDFGIAKATASRLTERTHFTAYGVFIGTPEYMSPEQALGSVDIDTRTDVYSLGVLLYELLVGEPPFDAKSLRAAGYGEMQRILAEMDPPTPSSKVSLAPDRLARIASKRSVDPERLGRLVRGELDWIVMKALEKNRSRRYEGAGAFAEDVSRYLRREPILAAPVSNAYRVRKFVVRNRVLVAASTAILALLICGIAGTSWGMVREAQQRRVADAARAVALAEKAAADSARSDAETQRSRADARAAEAEWQSYVGNVSAAAAAVRIGEHSQTTQYLDACREDLRDWEWEYLRALAEPSFAVLRGHTDRINSLAFRPDGSEVATGSSDGTCAVWRTEDGRRVAVLGGHASAVLSVVWSPDGRRIATGSSDHTARIWDSSAHHQLLELRGHTRPITSVRFAPDGARVLTASDDGTARLWDASEGSAVVTLVGHDGPIESAMFSPDGKAVATASQDSTARVWSSNNGVLVVVLHGHRGSVHRVVFSPDGRLLATCSDDATARLWNASSGELLHTLSGHNGSVNDVCFSPDSTLLATAGDWNDKTIRLWSATTGELKSECKGHTQRINSVSFSSDGRFVVSGSAWNESVGRIWDARNGAFLGALRAHTFDVLGATVSADSRQIATWGVDHEARLWDSAPNRHATLTGHRWFVRSARYSADGERIVTASDDTTARVWNSDSGETLGLPAMHDSRVWSATFSPDGSRIATGSQDRTARIFDSYSGEVLITLVGHEGTVGASEFSRDGRRVLTSSADKTARIWDATTGKALLVVPAHSAPIQSSRFSPDDSRFVTASLDGTAKVWDSSTGQLLATLDAHAGEVGSAEFRPDGAEIVTGHRDGSARVWDARSGDRRLTLQGHVGWVMGSTYNPMGTRIATCSTEGTVRIWDARTGRQLLEVPNEQIAASAYGVAFSPDGKRLVVARSSSPLVLDTLTASQIRSPLDGFLATKSSVTSTVRSISTLLDDPSSAQRAVASASWPDDASRRAALAVLHDILVGSPDQEAANLTTALTTREFARPLLLRKDLAPETLAMAIELSRRVARLIPEAPQYLDVVVFALYRAGDYEGCARTLAELRRRFTLLGFDRDPYHVAFQALTMAKLGRETEACEAIQELGELCRNLRASKDPNLSLLFEEAASELDRAESGRR